VNDVIGHHNDMRNEQMSSGLRQHLERAYFRRAGRLWRLLPRQATELRPVKRYGVHLHGLAQRVQPRTQNHSTYFFRNRPEMDLMRRLASHWPSDHLSVAVMGCSKGAEVYSIAYSIRSARPDLALRITASDISQEVLDFASKGVYASDGAADQKAARMTARDQVGFSIFHRTTPTEVAEMFDEVDGGFAIKPWLRQDVTWTVGDVSDQQNLSRLGAHDIVVGNRFLCHMDRALAARCLRNMAGIVKRGGYLFVSGVDGDVKVEVARSMGWTPVAELMREVYDGDSSLRDAWPLEYWTCEPFDAARSDGRYRYASVFRTGAE